MVSFTTLSLSITIIGFMTDRKKISGKIQVAILVFFIVFMPLGSWYYLQSGFNYHKKLMSDLKDYGKIPEFNLLTQNGDSLNSNDLHGKIMIVNFYAENKPSTALTTDYARKILSQFKNRTDLIFLFHSLNPEMQHDSLLKAVAEKENLLNHQVYFLSGDEVETAELFTLGYKIPMPEKKAAGQLPEECPFFVLIDTNLTIRNYYDVNDKTSMDRLVEHLAIILPREKKSKAERIPQKEK